MWQTLIISCCKNVIDSSTKLLTFIKCNLLLNIFCIQYSFQKALNAIKRFRSNSEKNKFIHNDGIKITNSWFYNFKYFYNCSNLEHLIVFYMLRGSVSYTPVLLFTNYISGSGFESR